MQTKYYLNTSELDEDFIASVKKLFANKKIEITISEYEDETEYLMKSKKNKERLLNSIKNADEGIGLKEMDLDQVKKLANDNG